MTSTLLPPVALAPTAAPADDALAAHPLRHARPDTRDMVVVHRIFRRELRLAPELVRATAHHDRQRAELVAEHVLQLVDLLHHHHVNEDQLLWPLLHDRAPMDADLVNTMERQHATVAARLAPVAPLTERWRAEPSAANRDVLAIVLESVLEPLVEHLDLEERAILPLVREHLTGAEYAQLGERARASIPKDRMPMVLGAMLEDATPAERQMMTAGMPRAAKVLWALVGRRRYRAATRALRTV